MSANPLHKFYTPFFLCVCVLASLSLTRNIAHAKKGKANTHGIITLKLRLRPIQEAHSRITLLSLWSKDGIVEGRVDVIGFQVQVREIGQGSVEGSGEELEVWGLDYWIGW